MDYEIIKWYKYKPIYEILKKQIFGHDCARLITYNIYLDDKKKYANTKKLLKRLYDLCRTKMLRKHRHKSWVKNVYKYLQHEITKHDFLSKYKGSITNEIDQCNYFIDDGELFRVCHHKGDYYFERYYYYENYGRYENAKNYLIFF